MQAGKKANRQASRQALGRHSVGAMPWRGLLKCKEEADFEAEHDIMALTTDKNGLVVIFIQVHRTSPSRAWLLLLLQILC